MTLADFREATAANTATPSCGAAAVVAADLGLALILMALRITESKQPDLERARLIERAENLLIKLGAYADADIKAFKTYMNVMKEKDEPQKEVKNATQQVVEVPLATAKACLEGVRLAKQALPLTVEPVRSDILSGALLLQAGLSAVLLNVDVNLSNLQETHARDAAKRARSQLQDEADELLAELRRERVC
ncbi:cyclodeaminase/cyclohydrolase family protein [Pseudomonas duriflava]|nr:cyclodeaminase/cyclohydrolase family protein [Pseudomonas duriflava]